MLESEIQFYKTHADNQHKANGKNYLVVFSKHGGYQVFLSRSAKLPEEFEVVYETGVTI
jgi:hypothetical protein